MTRARQQEMQFRTHGGARARAGRKPTRPGRPRLRHGKRPALAARFPVHVCYVLQNARRHGEPIDPCFGGMDPFSSAWWFDGWQDASWKAGIPPPEVRTVAAAETWLLRVGWKRSTAGLLSITEVPPAGRR